MSTTVGWANHRNLLAAVSVKTRITMTLTFVALPMTHAVHATFLFYLSLTCRAFPTKVTIASTTSILEVHTLSMGIAKLRACAK